MKEYQIEVLTDLESEPVTLQETKAWLRIDADFFDDDNILNTLITSSRELLEKYTNLAFGVKELKVRFSDNCIELPYGPTVDIISVTDVKTGDAISADKYEIRGLTYKSIVLNSAYNASWFYPLGGGTPQLWEGNVEHIEVDVVYTTGFSVLPKALKNALLTQIDYMYKNIGETNLEPLNPVAEKLASPYSRNLVL